MFSQYRSQAIWRLWVLSTSNSLRSGAKSSCSLHPIWFVWKHGGQYIVPLVLLLFNVLVLFGDLSGTIFALYRDDVYSEVGWRMVNSLFFILFRSLTCAIVSWRRKTISILLFLGPNTLPNRFTYLFIVPNASNASTYCQLIHLLFILTCLRCSLCHSALTSSLRNNTVTPATPRLSRGRFNSSRGFLQSSLQCRRVWFNFLSRSTILWAWTLA